MKIGYQKRCNLLILVVERTFPDSSCVVFVVMWVLPFGQDFVCPLVLLYTMQFVDYLYLTKAYTHSENIVHNIVHNLYTQYIKT